VRNQSKPRKVITGAILKLPVRPFLFANNVWSRLIYAFFQSIQAAFRFLFDNLGSLTNIFHEFDAIGNKIKGHLERLTPSDSKNAEKHIHCFQDSVCSFCLIATYTPYWPAVLSDRKPQLTLQLPPLYRGPTQAINAITRELKFIQIT